MIISEQINVGDWYNNFLRFRASQSHINGHQGKYVHTVSWVGRQRARKDYIGNVTVNGYTEPYAVDQKKPSSEQFLFYHPSAIFLFILPMLHAAAATTFTQIQAVSCSKHFPCINSFNANKSHTRSVFVSLFYRRRSTDIS